MRIINLIDDKDFDCTDGIKRWVLMNTHFDENISNHTYWVSLFSFALAEDLFPADNPSDLYFKWKILSYAVLHDVVDEIFTGDVPHMVKNNPFNGLAIKEEIKKYADWKINQKMDPAISWNKSVQQFVNKKDEFCYSIAKIADWLSMIRFVNREVNMGNKTVDSDLLYCLQSCYGKIEDVLLFAHEEGVKINERSLTVLKQDIKNLIAKI